jgi:hypothetical protein
MAKTQVNPILQELSGSLGSQLMFRRLRDGRTIVCARPDFSRRKLSAGQKAHHERFKAASVYAKAAAQTQPIYAQLAAGTMKTAYNLALSDWFHPPVIHQVELRDGTVRIWASDDVCVAQVTVSILDETGNVVQQGLAVQAQQDWWSFTPTPPITGGCKVVVEAQDLAGNGTRMEKEVG